MVRKRKVKMTLKKVQLTFRKKKEEGEVNSDAEKSDEPNTNSPVKTENAEQSPVNVVHGVLVGGVSADLIDNEEDR